MLAALSRWEEIVELGGNSRTSVAPVVTPIKTAESSFGFGSKIIQQMNRRGWDGSSIDDTISNPHATSPAINKTTGGGSTAYFNKDGSYVVRDNASNNIIQISNRNDPNWIPDSTITNPYTPSP